MSAKRLMIQGTASSVGKSLLVTALCRIFRRKGLSVAPFKSQNMSLNSFITEQGHEMGRAQVAQAEAAGIAPSSLMNPLLLKPTGDQTSQVIVMGKVLATLDARAYYALRPRLTDAVRNAFEELARRHDLILIEGAGSPAEINLRENDIANMGMAEMADAPVLLVGDIDRGGVFASLYGTVKLLPEHEQRRIRAFVVNKFRGDVSILEPGLRELQGLLQRPVLGVLPYWNVRIDEEDSLTQRFDPHASHSASVSGFALDIVVPRLPRLSNFTDFAIFDTLPGIRLRYVDTVHAMGKPDLIILPGSKNTLGDMHFLHESGLAGQILELHAAGVPLIGVCGGFQMLGKSIRDPLGAETDMREIRGLGVLDMDTLFAAHKRTEQSSLTISPEAAKGILHGTGGLRLKGYEIHMGESAPLAPGSVIPLGHLENGRPEGMSNASGTVFGTYLHGIFDNSVFTRSLLNTLLKALNRPPLPAGTQEYADFREAEYDRLADMVEEHLDMAALQHIIDGQQ